jgi:RNA polymerase sigma-70 factor (ECF subfamily)
MAQDGDRARRRSADDAPQAEQRGTRELRVVSGETYADWHAVYADNVDRIHRLMFAKVGNRADAEDLTAEVFLAALGPMRVSASVGEVRAYLLATARTVLARHWRTTMGREITTIDEEQLEQGSQDDPVSDAPQRAAAILQELPERDRRILSLRFLQSYSIKDAAVALGVTVANAKVLQHRALRRAAQLGEGRA